MRGLSGLAEVRFFGIFVRFRGHNGHQNRGFRLPVLTQLGRHRPSGIRHAVALAKDGDESGSVRYKLTQVVAAGSRTLVDLKDHRRAENTDNKEKIGN